MTTRTPIPLQSPPMPDLHSLTAPLAIRLPDGTRHVMVERFHHPRGLLWFEPFWHLGEPDRMIHLAEGTVRGEGPWKIGEAVVTVLGCQGTDPALAAAFEEWRQYLATHAPDYPPRPLIEAIARRYGAVMDAASPAR